MASHQLLVIRLKPTSRQLFTMVLSVDQWFSYVEDKMSNIQAHMDALSTDLGGVDDVEEEELPAFLDDLDSRCDALLEELDGIAESLAELMAAADGDEVQAWAAAASARQASAVESVGRIKAHVADCKENL